MDEKMDEKIVEKNVDKSQNEESKQEVTDIFHWANRADAAKNDLDIELFLFNKNYTPFSVKLDSSLDSQLKPFFLLDYINYVNLGAGTGLSVRDYELSEAEENVLLRTELEKVGRADTLLHLIEKQRSDVIDFNETDHELKKIKGVLARITSKKNPETLFYSVKLLQTAGSLKGATAWQVNGSTFESFSADVGFKIPTDNQVLIIGQDIFIFNQSKFERLFNYDFKKQALADKQVAEIEQRYKLSFPEGLNLQALVKDRKKTINKLQKLEIGEVSQEQAVDYADEMQLDLMTDDDGSIIIMDGSDLDTFVNLINEDYITSAITGKRYEIKSKKLLKDSEGEAPRGMA